MVALGSGFWRLPAVDFRGLEPRGVRPPAVPGRQRDRGAGARGPHVGDSALLRRTAAARDTLRGWNRVSDTASVR